MTMLQGMKVESTKISDRSILDPANGKVYKSKMIPIKDGEKLNLKGYIGLPIIGRTLTWVREELL